METKNFSLSIGEQTMNRIKSISAFHVLLTLLIGVIGIQVFTSCSSEGGGVVETPSSNSVGDGSSSSADDGNSSGSVNELARCLEAADSPVACYGKLWASGNKLVGSKTEDRPVILRGVSLGWSNTGWQTARFFNEETVNAMVDHWKAEIIRVSVGHGLQGSSEYSGSYLADKNGNMNRARTAIDAAISKDAYVVIDWHSYNAHLDVESSIEFFGEMARDYGDYDNVIFEIYNEPVCSDGAASCQAGGRTTWAEIKVYADQVIPVIREHSQNLILVGTPSWSQNVNAPLADPIADDNIAYVLHFYAQTHNLNSFRTRIDQVLNANYPVFVSEYGTTDAGGGQPPNNFNSHNESNSNAWHAYMDEKMISSVAWNVNDKAEGSAFFGFNPRIAFDMESWTDETKMSVSGRYIFRKLRAYAESAGWRGGER
ncbi:MAG: glycoside hydrolase family 5 protein [Fibromonadales bacterium]|nr:glycoside hydrolase family 5 protein [Fibromonadales bacterium]